MSSITSTVSLSSSSTCSSSTATAVNKTKRLNEIDIDSIAALDVAKPLAVYLKSIHDATKFPSEFSLELLGLVFDYARPTVTIGTELKTQMTGYQNRKDFLLSCTLGSASYGHQICERMMIIASLPEFQTNPEGYMKKWSNGLRLPPGLCSTSMSMKIISFDRSAKTYIRLFLDRHYVNKPEDKEALLAAISFDESRNNLSSSQ